MEKLSRLRQVGKLRNMELVAVSGLALLVGPAGLAGCSKEQDKPVQKTQQKEAGKKSTIENILNAIDTEESFVDKIEVKINDKEPFYLKHKGEGNYVGRQNELIGSKIVELKYNSDNQISSVNIRIEGSLFNPERSYKYWTSNQIIGKGTYTTKSKDGEKINFQIINGPLYEADKGYINKVCNNLREKNFEGAEESVRIYDQIKKMDKRDFGKLVKSYDKCGNESLEFFKDNKDKLCWINLKTPRDENKAFLIILGAEIGETINNIFNSLPSSARGIKPGTMCGKINKSK